MTENIILLIAILVDIWINWYTWKNIRDINKLQRKLTKSNQLYYLCLKYVRATEENNKKVMRNTVCELRYELEENAK